MLGITIIICVFLFMTTALIMSTIENKAKMNNELLDILENLNDRIKILEKDHKSRQERDIARDWKIWRKKNL